MPMMFSRRTASRSTTTSTRASSTPVLLLFIVVLLLLLSCSSPLAFVEANDDIDASDAAAAAPSTNDLDLDRADRRRSGSIRGLQGAENAGGDGDGDGGIFNNVKASKRKNEVVGGVSLSTNEDGSEPASGRYCYVIVMMTRAMTTLATMAATTAATTTAASQPRIWTQMYLILTLVPTLFHQR